MQNVAIERIKLLEIVKENRERHQTIYSKLMQKFQKAVVVELEKEIKRFQKEEQNKRPSAGVSISVLPPSSYISHYDRAIRMLELDNRAVVEIEEREFDQYVLDKWGWQANYLSHLTAYIKGGSIPDTVSQSLERADIEDYITTEVTSVQLLEMLSKE